MIFRAIVIAVVASILAAGCGDSNKMRVDSVTQTQLPLDMSMVNLCPGASSPQVMDQLEHETDVMLTELHDHPGYLVTPVVYYADGEPEEREEEREITVRELAELRLQELKDGAFGVDNCRPDIQRRIEAALIEAALD